MQMSGLDRGKCKVRPLPRKLWLGSGERRRRGRTVLYRTHLSPDPNWIDGGTGTDRGFLDSDWAPDLLGRERVPSRRVLHGVGFGLGPVWLEEGTEADRCLVDSGCALTREGTSADRCSIESVWHLPGVDRGGCQGRPKPHRLRLGSRPAWMGEGTGPTGAS